MSVNLTAEEKAYLEEILSDLRLLFDKKEISSNELKDVLNQLRSEEVRKYLDYLAIGSKPESALREALLTFKSVLSKYLYGEGAPEVREDGFVDYLIKDDMGRTIVLELKSPFIAKFEKDKRGERMFKKIIRTDLDWKKHKDQIAKYIPKSEYVILSNLKDWVFFSRNVDLKDPKPFAIKDLFEFVDEYKTIGNLKDYADRLADQSVRYDLLAEEFFEDLKRWVASLQEVRFKEEDKKLELIIGLINKFIFIQTLDDYGVVDFKWILNAWEHHEKRWSRKGELEVLKNFFKEIDEWFYSFYDTELFRENLLEYVEEDEGNIRKLYSRISLVLGVDYWKGEPGATKGIMQYNFRHIDEDVLGKAYEEFLADQRKEKGAFYTPKYVTEYIVESTVGKLCEEILEDARKAVEKEDLGKLEALIERFISIKVLDPACGSGSFLIKALRRLYKAYEEFIDLLRRLKERLDNWETLIRPEEVEAKVERLDRLLYLLEGRGRRDRISKVLLRHIHGVDLDGRALEVAKLNLWLEAIKLAPEEFRYDRLPRDTNHILPDLEMNLRNGDSLVGLPEQEVISLLVGRSELSELWKLRKDYLEDPSKPEIVNMMEEILNGLRGDLNREFDDFLRKKEISLGLLEETVPFHWPLEFWYVFFDENGALLSDERIGFDAVVGNPPYIDSELMTKILPITRHYISKIYESASGNWDIFCPFLEKGILLMKSGGRLSFIVPNKLLSADYAKSIRSILKNYRIEVIQDYSKIKVFAAAVYPIVLVLSKRSWKDDDELVIDIFYDDGGQILKTSHEFPLKMLYSLPNNLWSPALTPFSMIILNKVLSRSSPLEKYCDVMGGATVKEAYKIAPKLLELDRSIKEEYFKFVNTGIIERYIPLWGYKDVRYLRKKYKRPIILKNDLMTISPKRYRQAVAEKNIVAGMGLRLRSAYDKGECLAGKSTTVVISKSIDPKALTGLLNSSLLTFMIRVFFENLSLQGGYLRIGPPQIKELPLSHNLLNKKHQKILGSLVDKIISLMKYRLQVRASWLDWSEKLKNNKVRFYDILEYTRRGIQEGNLAGGWIANVSFFPSTNPSRGILDKIFREFKIRGRDRTLEIYGIDEEGNEELVYQIEFREKDLMLHTYLSILYLLTTGQTVKTLKDVLEKTEIPIIHPITNTINIIRKVREELSSQMPMGISDAADIATIEEEIENLDARIDLLVFDLYGLDKNEVASVLESLKLPLSYRRKVLEGMQSE